MEEYTSKQCPYCHTEIKEDDMIIICPSCGTIHHESCWNKNKGCTVYGCSEQHNFFRVPDMREDDGSNTSVSANETNINDYHIVPQNSNKQNFCIKCGTPLREGQVYCHKCGKPVNSIESNAIDTAYSEPKERKKISKKLLIPIICVIAVVAVIGVLLVVRGIPVEMVELSEASVELEVDETKQMGYTVTPSDATLKNIVWESSDEQIATVDSSGVITAKKEGSCIILVTVDGITDDMAVVVKIGVESVKLSESSIELREQETKSVNYTVTPKEATNKDAVWKSSDEQIASVDSTGKITAKKEGTCTITVTVDGKTDEIDVVVKSGPNFQEVYDTIGGEGYYCILADDGSYLSIDTNPLDFDDYSNLTAWDMIKKANAALDLPDSVLEKMQHTTALQGRQTATHNGVTVSWTYHPDKGLSVMYEEAE